MKADGLEVWKQVGIDRPVRPVYYYLVKDTEGDRTQVFVRKKDAVRYFKEATAEYCVKDNTLWDKAKLANIIVKG